MPTPNTVLIRTEITATSAVSLSACTTSGSASASWMPVSPSANVCRTTYAVGHATSMPRYATTRSRSTHFTAGDPVPTAVLLLAMARHPPLEDVERDDRQQRDQQHDRRHRRRGLGVAALEEREQPDRDHLGAVGEVAADQHERAVLADAAGERQRRARADRRHQGRQDHPAERREPGCAERRRGVLDVGLELL